MNTYVPIFRGLDARGGRKLRTDTHTHKHTHTGQLKRGYNHVNTTLIKIGVAIFISVAIQPEALVAATLAVSQERKSFTTNHTSILKIVRFNAKRGSIRCLTQPFLLRFRWGRQTHTHRHTQNDYRNPRCPCAPRVNKHVL